MYISCIEASPFHSFDHLSAAGKGKSETLPISLYRAVATGIPDDLDAIVVASDLQGVAPLAADGGEYHLAGEVLACVLADLVARGDLPPSARTGVILAGDLYSSPMGDERGATGDVRDVWRALAEDHAWVVGVAGNHDTFGDRNDQARFAREPRIHLLDGECTELDSLRFGGLAGIIGNARKPGRREEDDFVRDLRDVLTYRPDVLILHHGPDGEHGERRGHPMIREALEGSGSLLVVCGHGHWDEPLAMLRDGPQVLNVDGRVVVLGRPRD